MVKATDISVSSVRRIRKARGLRPHRMQTFKLSNDPKFADKKIRALDRTQPGLR